MDLCTLYCCVRWYGRCAVWYLLFTFIVCCRGPFSAQTAFVKYRNKRSLLKWTCTSACGITYSSCQVIIIITTSICTPIFANGTACRWQKESRAKQHSIVASTTFVPPHSSPPPFTFLASSTGWHHQHLLNSKPQPTFLFTQITSTYKEKKTT